MKLDRHARKCWGRAYGAIPKSVFATLAWHLARRMFIADAYAIGAENAERHPNHVELKAIAELERLKDVCSPGQAERAIKSIHDYLSARARAPSITTEGK